jgi:hypothetical protein
MAQVRAAMIESEHESETLGEGASVSDFVDTTLML